MTSFMPPVPVRPAPPLPLLPPDPVELPPLPPIGDTPPVPSAWVSEPFDPPPHDITSAYHVADRLVLLYQGKVVFTGTPDETRKTSDPIVKQFIQGSSQGPIQPA